MNKKKKIILIDGSLYLYIFYYKFIKITDKNDNKIGIIYGMFNLLKKIIYKFDTKYISIIYDYPSKNFRKILYKKYKSNRKKCPEDIIKQFKILKKLLLYTGLKVVSIPSIESDDVIGTLAKKAEINNYKVIILTKDKDMIQLINKNIKIVDISYNEKIINKNSIYNKYNIKPKYIVDYLSLKGDYTDNIPGIKLIGHKTALEIIKNFKNIKNLYINIKKINNLNIKNKKNIILNIKNNKKLLFFYYKLIKIKENIFTGYKIKEFKINKKCINKILNICEIYNKRIKYYNIN